MRRSGYRKPFLAHVDLETYDPATQTYGAVSEQSIYVRTIPREERKKIAKNGWPNWFINRGRMSRNPTAPEKRRYSWRRVH